MKTRTLLSLCLLALLAAPLVRAEAPHVANGATPRDGVVELRAEPEWTAGGLDDDANLFGVVARVLADADGNLYVLDNQLSEIAVLSRDGERIGTLSREGEGPGETRRPNDLMFLPDGKLGIVQVFPGKIVKIGTDGTPDGNFPFHAGDPSAGSFGVVVRAQSRGGTIALCGIRQTFAQGKLDQLYFLGGYAADGAQNAVFAEKTAQQNFADMVLDEAVVDFVWNRFSLAEDGSMIVAPARNEYRLEVHAPDGALLRTFGREYATLSRTDEDTRRAKALLDAQGRNYPVPPRTVIMDTEADIIGITAGANGEVRVLTSRGVRNQPAGTALTYDVFDAAGVFVRQERLLADAEGLNDLVFTLNEDRFVIIRNFWQTFISSMGGETGAEESAPMEVVSCRILR
jgi:hypothetical protein